MSGDRWRRLKQATELSPPEPELPIHQMVTPDEAERGSLVFSTCGLKLFETKYARIARVGAEVTCVDCLRLAAENARKRARWRRLRSALR